MSCTTMRITPLDVRNHPFEKKMRGYDPEEVHDFLRAVAGDYEGVLRENQGQRDRIIQLEARLEELTATESILKDTLTTAQRLSDDLKSTAVKEAEVLLSEAEIKGEKILDAAHRRAAKLAEDIREMKLLRSRLASAVRGTIETHLSLLEGLAEDAPEEPGLDGKLHHLSRRAPRASDGKTGSEG